MTEEQDRQSGIYWRTTSFQAAPPGWRLLSIFVGQRDVTPIAGWLFQERHDFTYTDAGDDERLESKVGLDAAVGPSTRVIPGLAPKRGFDWEVVAIDIDGTQELWKVLGPNEEDPTDEEWEAEIARRGA